MRSSLLYRVASILIFLFAAGHTFSFRQVDPNWGAGSTVEAMKSLHFQVQGFSRSYWDFYVGFGLFVTAFQLLAGVLAWQLGGLSRHQLGFAQGLAWGLTLCFGATAVLSWRYFFAAPLIFSSLIFGCLLTATLSSRSAEAR